MNADWQQQAETIIISAFFRRGLESNDWSMWTFLGLEYEVPALDGKALRCYVHSVVWSTKYREKECDNKIFFVSYLPVYFNLNYRVKNTGINKELTHCY